MREMLLPKQGMGIGPLADVFVMLIVSVPQLSHCVILPDAGIELFFSQTTGWLVKSADDWGHPSPSFAVTHASIQAFDEPDAPFTEVDAVSKADIQ
jgi:hypothetical protein